MPSASCERRRFLLFAVLLFVAPGRALAAERISAAEAHRHVGERATVCGKVASVASASFAAESSRQPTFLNLDEPYPEHVFSVVIWGEHRDRFPGPPERFYRDKSLCVTGEITAYQDRPQIVADHPRQIEIAAEEPAARAPAPRAPEPRGCIDRSRCCKVCSAGKACGNSCIRRSYTCHKGRGYACDSWEVC